MPESLMQSDEQDPRNVNPKNIYTGPDSLKRYFDPDSAPPLPLIELPPHLNPYYDDGVRIYAKMMSSHPANNVKSMPAMNLLSKEVTPKTKTIVEYSSGSTVTSMSMVSRIYHNITDNHAYLSNKTSLAKLRLLQFFGLKLTLFGGPHQPSPTDPRGGIQCARAKAADSNGEIVNPNQYENDANWHSHMKWTGPQILWQLPQISVLCAGIGTSGTMTGLGMYFKREKPSVFRLGVCTAPGERVNGPRSYALLAPVEFPWREAVDHIELMGNHDSLEMSLKLCRNGLLCGPSSGFNLQGLLKFLGRRKEEGTLRDLASEDGKVHCVFICCDLPYQYVQEYFDVLGPEAFPPITNEQLTKVDRYRYDDAWEVAPEVGLQKQQEMETLLVDFRRQADFRDWHFPGALNIPLASLTSESGSPFFAPEVLAQQWTELEDLFGQSFLQSQFADRKLLCLCYNGDTARVATSVLRAKGFVAESVKGGSRALVAVDASLPKQYAVKVAAPVVDSVMDIKSEKAMDSDSRSADSSDGEA